MAKIEGSELKVPRVDIAATIEGITFPDAVWEWLDLLSDLIEATDREALAHESFLADTEYKKYLMLSIHKDITAFKAVYLLLRCEMVHQAAAQVRILCEGVITRSYVAQDSETRAQLFWEYMHVEGFEIAGTLLEWERNSAKPEHVRALEQIHDELRPECERVRPRYLYEIKRGKRKGTYRPFLNWCNKSVAGQARQCAVELSKLYDLVYAQMSAYVHGSGWSLRRQIAYSPRNYDSTVVMVDVATIVRTTLVVWVEFAKFCIRELEWRLALDLAELVRRCDALDEKYYAAKSREQDI